MTSTTARRLRLGAAALGALAIGTFGAASAASATGAPPGDGEVEVGVEIAELAEPGSLAMTVAASSTALEEAEGADDLERVFTGTLPTVTVTDTRSADEIPEGAYWTVLGSISDFAGSDGQPAILAADAFGWTPALLDGDPGSVSEGDAVAPGEGFRDVEMLAMAYDSAGIAAEGSWSANAGLVLRTPVTVAPGAYSATLTLSLFE